MRGEGLASGDGDREIHLLFPVAGDVDETVSEDFVLTVGDCDTASRPLVVLDEHGVERCLGGTEVLILRDDEPAGLITLVVDRRLQVLTRNEIHEDGVLGGVVMKRLYNHANDSIVIQREALAMRHVGQCELQRLVLEDAHHDVPA